MDNHPEWIIVGAGGFAREVAWNIETGDANGGVLMAVEPEYLPPPGHVGNYEVVTIEDAMARADGGTKWILGVGSVALRRRLVDIIEETGVKVVWGVVQSPTALVEYRPRFARGAYIGPRCVVSVFTVIAKHALVNQCCSIGHDCTIGPHAVICPGCILSGSVVVGAGAVLGSGVIVYPAVRIGEGAKVSAGTVVTHNVPAHHIRCSTDHATTVQIVDRWA